MIAVRDSRGILIELFERIENFFKRLETYVEVPPTIGMTDIIVKIMIQVLSVLTIATREIKQSRASGWTFGHDHAFELTNFQRSY